MTSAEIKMAKTAPEDWHKGGVDARRWGSALHRILQRQRPSDHRDFCVFTAAVSSQITFTSEPNMY